jgi:hypothetical protein
MPRLIFFGVCQKAIIDKQDGNVSMITLLHSITVQIVGEEDLPADAMIQAPWATVATWWREPADEGRTFQPRVELLFPSDEHAIPPIDGDPFIPETVTYTTVTNAIGLPVARQGSYTVRVSLREVGSSEWHIAGTVPLEILFQRQEPEPLPRGLDEPTSEQA